MLSRVQGLATAGQLAAGVAMNQMSATGGNTAHEPGTSSVLKCDFCIWASQIGICVRGMQAGVQCQRRVRRALPDHVVQFRFYDAQSAAS